MLQLIKKFFVPTAILGWATYYYIEILGKKASAGYFIKPVFWILAVLYVVIIIMDVRELRASQKREQIEAQTDTEEVRAEKVAKRSEDNQDTIRTIICLGSSVVYIFLLPYLGFIIATTLFLFGLFWWLKAKNKLLAFVLAVVVTMGMYALFGLGLKVPLYTGFLGF
jgi:putative tricarboxylic transport membrane protein